MKGPVCKTDDCEVIKNHANGDEFWYCRTCKAEVKDLIYHSDDEDASYLDHMFDSLNEEMKAYQKAKETDLEEKQDQAKDAGWYGRAKC